MALTRIDHTGDGTTSQYDITFDLGYLREEFVYVYLEGDDYTNGLGYSWINSTRIQLDTPVADGVSFHIRRVIPRDKPVNDYQEGAILREDNLDDSFVQSIMILQEIQDGYLVPSGDFLIDSNLNMLQHEIVNCIKLSGLNYAVGADEAVPLQQLLDYLSDVDFQGVIPLLQPRQQGDGVTVTFATPATQQYLAESFFINIDAAGQRPYTDFTVNNDGTVTFDEAPPNGADIDITLFQPVNVGDLSGANVTATGSTTPRTLGDRFADFVNVKDFGAIGDGVTDDSLAIQAAINASVGTVLFPDMTFNLGGNTIDIPSYTSVRSSLATTILNGEINASATGITEVNLGDITLVDCPIRIGGTVGEDNFGTKFSIGRIVSNDIVRLQYLKDFSIRSIRVDIPAGKDSPTQRAMGFTSLYEGFIETIHMSGYYAMGFETAGNGSEPDAYASRNVSISDIISERNPSATSAAGLHGVYLHGNYNLKVGSVLSTGYDISEQGISNDFKFRDNWECQVGDVTCLTAQLASDANSTTLNSLRNNVLSNVFLTPDPSNTALIGKMTATTSGAGVMSRNIINNFKGELGTSGTLASVNDDAITLTGYITFVKDGDLQMSNIQFESATVQWDDATTNYYTRELVAHNSHFLDIIRTTSSLATYNCSLQGGVRLETRGSTRKIIHHNTVVEGSWVTILSTGTCDGELSNTYINAPHPGATQRPNGTIDYRFASFNTGYYLASTDGTGFTPV